MEYLQTQRVIAFMPAPTDFRKQRQADILYALQNEPLTLDQGIALMDELAALEADLQRNPPETDEEE